MTQINHTLPATYTPEQFGAVGDGVHDDYPALLALSKALVDGCVVNFDSNACYFIDQVKGIGDRRVKITPYGENGVDDIVFNRLKGVTINFNGCSFKHSKVDRFDDNGDFPYSKKSTVCPVFLSQCYDMTVNGPVNIKGPADISSLGEGVSAGPCHGLVVYGGGNVFLNDINCEKWLGDGIWIGAYLDEDTGERDTTGLVVTKNCKGFRNARQGVSVTGCAAWVDIDGVYEQSGNTNYGWHNPACGIDIEPLPKNSQPTTVFLKGTKLIDNEGGVIAVNDHWGRVRLVDMDEVLFHRELDTVKRRAVGSSLIFGSDKVVIRRSEITNCCVRSTRGNVQIANTLSENKDTTTPSVFCINDSRLDMSASKFEYAAESKAKVTPFRVDKGSLFDNEFVLGSKAHDSIGSDGAAIIKDVDRELNHWVAESGISNSWNVNAEKKSKTDTFSGNIRELV